MSQDACILTPRDFTILEIMLDRSGDLSDQMRALLRRKLDTAVVTFGDDVPPDVATLNSRITFRINVSETDTRVLSKDHSRSPVGMFLPITSLRGLALLGLREGQEFMLETAEGRQDRLLLEQVHYQPEAALTEKRTMARLDTPASRRAAFRLVEDSSERFPAFMRATADDEDDPGPSAA